MLKALWIQNITKSEWAPLPIIDISWQFQVNPFISFSVILEEIKETDKCWCHVTSVVEIIIYI